MAYAQMRKYHRYLTNTLQPPISHERKTSHRKKRRKNQQARQYDNRAGKQHHRLRFPCLVKIQGPQAVVSPRSYNLRHRVAGILSNRENPNIFESTNRTPSSCPAPNIPETTETYLNSPTAVKGTSQKTFLVQDFGPHLLVRLKQKVFVEISHNNKLNT